MAGEAGYSFSLTTFSPSGKLLQIEHAFKAVQAGKTALGIQASNGVVLCTEKKSPSILVEEDSIERIVHYTGNIGVVYAGMGPDFRVLVRKGQKKAQEYKLTYGVRRRPSPLVRPARPRVRTCACAVGASARAQLTRACPTSPAFSRPCSLPRSLAPRPRRRPSRCSS